MRAVDEDARVDERGLAEERRHVPPVVHACEERHDPDGDALAPQAQRDGGELWLVGCRVVEVTDDEDRALPDVRRAKRTLGLGQTARDSRAAAELVPRRLREDRAAAVVADRDEERDE